MATPAIPVSEIGVSRIRSCPNSSDRPSVTVNAPPNPPGTPMSSPRQKTVGSRRISSRIPSRSASAIVISATSAALPEDMEKRILRRRGGAGLGKGDGGVYLCRHLLLDPLQHLRERRD